MSRRFLLWFAPAGLLIVAIWPWPYAYYMLVRVVTCLVCAGIGTYQLSKLRKLDGWTVAMFGVAVLFNPMIPIHLPREVWMLLDPAAAIVIICDYFSFRKSLRTSF